MALSTIDTSSISGLGYGFKNRIINGGMVFSQRGTTAFTQTTAQTYSLDRWGIYGSGGSQFTAQQLTASPPAGYKNYLGVVNSASPVTPTTTQEWDVYQYIEGYNIADLGWGSAGAQSVTLSFWVKSSVTGSFGGQVANYNSTRSYPFSYTINAANTWEQKTITVAGDTTGTWNTDNSIGFLILFSLGAGATKSGPANTWAAANYVQPTGSVALVSTASATWQITGVQLEAGTVATSFDWRSYGTELALCQRYCYVYNGTYYARKPMFGSGVNSAIWYPQYPVPMRVPPTTLTAVNVTNATIEAYNYSSAGAIGSISNAVLAEGDNLVGQVTLTFASNLATGQVASWRWTGIPASSFIFSSEL